MDEHAPPPYREDSALHVDDKKHLDDDDSPPYTDAPDVGDDLTASASAASSASTYGKRGPKLDTIPIDSSQPLKPTHTFWIPWFSTFSKTLKAYDISSFMASHWQGAVNKEYRELGKAMYDKYQKSSDRPAYSAVATGKFRHRYSFRDASGSEICEWKHGWSSLTEVDWIFPAETKTAFVKANKLWTRDRVFTIDGVMYAAEMDSSWRSNQWTISKIRGESKVPVARYGMRYCSGWFTGGCVVVDGEELDEALAVLACLTMIKQNKQRAAERGSGAAGGGGGS